MSSQALGFSPISPDDHAGYLWIVTILSTIYTGLAAAVRIRIKWGVCGLDDYFLGLATVLHFVQATVIFFGLANGLAKTNSVTTEDQWFITGKAFLISELLAVATLCLTKCSIVTLILRVLTLYKTKSWVVCSGFLFLNAVWGVGSVIGLSVNCNLKMTLTETSASQCPDQLLRWQIITAADMFTDVVNSLLPVALVWPVSMCIKMKFQVFLAFAFRLPMVIITAFHLSSFNIQESTEPQFVVATTLTLQQLMLTWSLISATIPNMKGFMQSFSVGMGVLRPNVTTNASYPLQPLRSGPAADNGHRPANTRSGLQTAVRPYNSAQLDSDGASASDSTGDDYSFRRMSGSQELIIRKEVKWSVHHELVSLK